LGVRRRFMRLSQPEKMKIIRAVENSPLGVKRTLAKVYGELLQSQNGGS